MKKVLLLLQILLLQNTIVIGQIYKDWYTYNLNGKVKTVKEYYYNDNEGYKYLHEVVDFDNKGNVISSTGYDMDGKVVSSRTTNFDTKYNLIESKYFTSGELMINFSYKYDTLNNLQQRVEYYNSGEMEKINYTRDKKGKIVQEDVYDKNNKFIEKRIWLYNNNVLYKIYCYDNFNKLTGDSTVYLYDGNSYTKTLYTALGAKIIKNYVNDKLRSEQEYTNSSYHKSTKNEYNSNGDIISHFMVFSSSNLIHIYKYEYDSNGNWVKKIEYSENGIYQSTIYRTLTYY